MGSLTLVRWSRWWKINEIKHKGYKRIERRNWWNVRRFAWNDFWIKVNEKIFEGEKEMKQYTIEIDNIIQFGIGIVIMLASFVGSVQIALLGLLFAVMGLKIVEKAGKKWSNFII